MEENSEKAKFEVVVPYNNGVLVAARKKSKIVQGVLWVVLALVFIAMAIGASTSSSSTNTIIAVFGCVAAFFVILALFSFLTIKPSSKNDDRTVKYDFYEDYIQIHNEKESKNKTKLLKSFLYRNYANKQFLDTVLEYSDRLVLKIYTGTYNGVPQYQNQIIPISALSSETEANDFKEFLKQKIENDYKIKNK